MISIECRYHNFGVKERSATYCHNNTVVTNREKRNRVLAIMMMTIMMMTHKKIKIKMLKGLKKKKV